MIRLVSRWLTRNAGLTARHDLDVTRGMRVAMGDGVHLLTDVYRPRGISTGPVVLIRSPYGRVAIGLEMAVPIATQGYHVVLQACRGTGGSEGTFVPQVNEQGDGLATLEWIRAQSWYDGVIFTYGASYLGYAQWAIARDAGPDVKGMAIQISASHFATMRYAGRSFLLELSLYWTLLMQRIRTFWGLLRFTVGEYAGRPSISAAQWRALPVATIDEAVLRRPVAWWREWLAHPSAEAEPWRATNMTQTLEDITRPITLVGGWFDIFIPLTLQDFAALHAAGRPVRITVGPWTHTDAEVKRHALEDALDGFARWSHGAAEHDEAPVKLFVMGDGWRRFRKWPPPDTVERPWYLTHDGALVDTAPEHDVPPTAWIYDPANPTPSVGGPKLEVRARPASVDNRALESRDDVLCFTSAPLEADLDVIGTPIAELWVTSNSPIADVFVRLCRVDESGVSRNICDHLERVPVDALGEPQAVRVVLWPTAQRFRRGDRLRIQVSGGAFPRWVRNPGTATPWPTSTELRPSEHVLHHSSAYPSQVLLPIHTAHER
ncbi:MAG: CocE/NonD family hydrolase [Myxococcota bacterium]